MYTTKPQVNNSDLKHFAANVIYLKSHCPHYLSFEGKVSANCSQCQYITMHCCLRSEGREVSPGQCRGALASPRAASQIVTRQGKACARGWGALILACHAGSRASSIHSALNEGGIGRTAQAISHSLVILGDQGL